MGLLRDYNPSAIEHLLAATVPSMIVSANAGQFIQDSKEGKAGLGIGAVAGAGLGLGSAAYLNSLDLASFDAKRAANSLEAEKLRLSLDSLPTDSLNYLNTKGQINELMDSPYSWNKGTRNEVYNTNPDLKKRLIGAQLLSIIGLPLTASLLGASIGNSFSGK